MDLEALHRLAATAWVAWFFLLFGGLVAWTLRPARRGHFERAGAIPLRDGADR